MIIVYVIGAFGALVTVTVARTAVKTVWNNLFRAKFKGAQGERKVRRCLKSLRRPGSQIRNDFLIKSKEKTTQIDHLMVTQHGIFVIETKNYSGHIEGTQYGNHWFQSFPGTNREPRKFLNPILQNKGHIRALQKLLPEYDDVPFRSIVAFTSKCVPPQLPGVTTLNGLNGVINSYCTGKPVLTREQVADITQKLDEKIITGRAARSTHNFRANLAAKASEVSSAQINSLITESAANAVRVTFPKPPAPVQDTADFTQRRQFTDIYAEVNIRGRTDTIDNFFENAKRRNDGGEVPKGGAFDYFICPFTGDKFPAEQATDYYQGLWITYFNQKPDLADYLKSHGHEDLGDSFRCKKVLALYNQDKDLLTGKVKASGWYQNMVKNMSRRKPAKQPLSSQIAGARSKTSNPVPSSYSRKNPHER